MRRLRASSLVGLVDGGSKLVESVFSLLTRGSGMYAGTFIGNHYSLTLLSDQLLRGRHNVRVMQDYSTSSDQPASFTVDRRSRAAHNGALRIFKLPLIVLKSTQH